MGYACKSLRRSLLAATATTASKIGRRSGLSTSLGSSNCIAFQSAAADLAFEAHALSSFDHPNIVKIRGWAANGIASYELGRHDSFFLMLDLLDDETLDGRIRRWRHRETQLQRSNEQQREEQKQAEYCVPFHVTLRAEKIRIITELAAALEYIHR